MTEIEVRVAQGTARTAAADRSALDRRSVHVVNVRAQLRWGFVALMIYVIGTAIVTWPTVAIGNTGIIGDALDPVQTLWGFWWWGHSDAYSNSRFMCNVLWWPIGTPMWFQTWDIPTATVASRLLSPANDVSVYNYALLATFPLSGLSMYLLARQQWGGTIGPMLSGTLYTFSTYHYAAAVANLHIASMEWSPLYFVGLHTLITRRSYLGAIIGGCALALTAAASIYHLLFCLVGTVVLAFAHRRTWPGVVHEALLPRLVVLFAVFATLAGWLIVRMALAYFSGPYDGAHSPILFSTDLQALFVPNELNRWSAYLPLYRDWTGRGWTTGAYTGYVAIGLAVAGARQSNEVKPYLAMAVLGAILSLGPFLHVGGVIFTSVLLPFGLLVKVMPMLAFGGIASRFAWLTTFGVAVGAGAMLCALCRQRRKGIAAATALTFLALLETWPAPLPATSLPRPAIMEEWALDSGRWAVLDATAASRPLWHQMIHRHPITGGYVTRAADTAAQSLWQDPVLRAFYRSASAWNLVELTPGSRRRLRAVPIPPQDPPTLTTTADAAAASLRDVGIRYVVVDPDQTSLPHAIGLREVYRGASLVVFSVW